VLLISAFVLIGLNGRFWRLLQVNVTPCSILEWLFLGNVFVVGFALLVILFGAFAIAYVFKPVATLLLLIAAGLAYFVDEYGVAIDAALIRNVTETNSDEAFDLLTLKLAGYLILGGALPSGILWYARV